jgi:hypothetical protein
MRPNPRSGAGRLCRCLPAWAGGGRAEPEPARWARLDFGVEATVVRAAVSAGRGVGGQRREERRDREEGPLVWVVLDGLEVGAYECRVRGVSLEQPRCQNSSKIWYEEGERWFEATMRPNPRFARRRTRARRRSGRPPRPFRPRDPRPWIFVRGLDRWPYHGISLWRTPRPGT